MKFSIHTPISSYDPGYPLNYYDLKEYRTQVLPLTGIAGGIVFDIDDKSLQNIEILSNTSGIIDFVDANNIVFLYAIFKIT